MPATSEINATLEVADSLVDSMKPAKVFEEKSDSVFQTRLRSLKTYRFKTNDDILARFPYPDELESEDGVHTWSGRIVLPQPGAEE